MPLLDLKLLLRAPYTVAKERREFRNGSDIADGLWRDLKDYFDNIVWKSHFWNTSTFLGAVEAGIVTRVESCS